MNKGLISLLVLASSVGWAQAPINMAADAHYHLLLENHQVQVFALTLRSTERTFVRHEHNFLVVTLRDCEIVMWREGQSDIQNFRFAKGEVSFFSGGQAVGLRNDRTHECDNITVEFLNPDVNTYAYSDLAGWGYNSGAVNPPLDPHGKFANSMLLGAAAASDVQLLPRDSYPPPEKAGAELLIPVTEVDLKGLNKHARKSPGDVLWIPASRTSALVNAGSEPARFAIVELWTGN